MAALRLAMYDPEETTHVAELRRQRILCGWGIESVDLWGEQCRRGDRALFWLFPVDAKSLTIPEVEPLSIEPTVGPPPPDASFQPVGHIGLDWLDYRGDKSLADRDEHRITLATFFILKSQQGSGLGRSAMDAVEAVAASPPFSARTITLNTIAAVDQTDQKWCKEVGYAYGPDLQANEPRYPWTIKRTGESVVLDGAFLKKELNPLPDVGS